jgi:hypothetical protein
MDKHTRRKTYIDLAIDLLEKNEKVSAIWADFEKNAFDEQDANYKAKDIFPRSGRYS